MKETKYGEKMNLGTYEPASASKSQNMVETDTLLAQVLELGETLMASSIGKYVNDDKDMQKLIHKQIREMDSKTLFLKFCQGGFNNNDTTL